MVTVDVVTSGKNMLPNYETAESAGCDVRANLEYDAEIPPGGRMLIPTGLQVKIPAGYEIQVRPRSGLALKKGITVLNTPGTIDEGYRNEWGAIVVNLSKNPVILRKGDKICQFILRKLVDYKFELTDDLTESERGLGGYGSTGKK